MVQHLPRRQAAYFERSNVIIDIRLAAAKTPTPQSAPTRIKGSWFLVCLKIKHIRCSSTQCFSMFDKTFF